MQFRGHLFSKFRLSMIKKTRIYNQPQACPGPWGMTSVIKQLTGNTRYVTSGRVIAFNSAFKVTQTWFRGDLTHYSLAWPNGHSRFYLKFKKNSGFNGLNKKSKFLQGPVSPNFCARRSVMMILNLSESLAKPLVMAKLNMAYLSSLKNQQNCCRPTCRCHHLGYSVPPALHRTIWCRSTFGPRGPGHVVQAKFLQGPVSPNFCARRSVMMILNLSESLAKPLVMAKLNMAYLSSLKNQQNCCRPTCRCHHLGYSVPPALHRTIWCRSTFGPRGPGHVVQAKFLQGPVSPNFCARRSVMMILNLSESLAKPLVMAKLNMAYLSSLKNQQNCCRPSSVCHHLCVSPSRVLRAPGTSPYHLVPKHLRTTWSRPEQSHLLPEACSPNGTDKRRQRQRQTERPPPEPSDFLKIYRAL